MADKVLCEKNDLVAVANAIRSKNGTTNTYKVNQLASAVENISSGTTLPTLSNPGSAADLRSGKQLIDQSGNKITGTLATVTQAIPRITVNSAGLITASATQSAGYVASGTKSATKQLPTKSAATITPGTSNQTIAAGTYLTGTQTIKGDANLVADNIKSGVSIFGVTGTASGGGGSGSTETCTFNVTLTNPSNYMWLLLVYLDINNNVVIRNAQNPVFNGDSIIMAKKPFFAQYTSRNGVYGSCSGCEIYSLNHTGPGQSEIIQTDAISNLGSIVIPTSDIITIVVSCFLPDTLISLADGTKKQIKDLTYSDNLLVWNFNEGKLDTASICWLTKSGLKNDHYYKLTFSDGTILKTTGQNSNHKIYNVDEHFFKGVDKTKIGDRIFSENGIVTVINKEYIEEEVEYYNLITTKYINCFAEGILTSDRYGNMYQHDENMMNIQDGRTIRPYNEFEAVGIKRYWYDTLCLGEVNGTINEIKNYIDKLECQMLTPPGYNKLK